MKEKMQEIVQTGKHSTGEWIDHEGVGLAIPFLHRF